MQGPTFRLHAEPASGGPLPSPAKPPRPAPVTSTQCPDNGPKVNKTWWLGQRGSVTLPVGTLLVPNSQTSSQARNLHGGKPAAALPSHPLLYPINPTQKITTFRSTPATSIPSRRERQCMFLYFLVRQLCMLLSILVLRIPASDAIISFPASRRSIIKIDILLFHPLLNYRCSLQSWCGELSVCSRYRHSILTS